MTPAIAIRIAAVFGFLSVALGAFGAHGLKEMLTQNQALDIWEKAVFYQFIHSVMLYVLATRPTFERAAFLLFVAGIVIFSGSLYVLAITGLRWLGAITPIGGLSFLAGWVWLFKSAGTRT